MFDGNKKKYSFTYVVKYLLLIFMDLFYKSLFSFIKKKNNPTKYLFCICSIFKNESPYIKEWIEYHLLIGVEHFYLYNNNSTDNFMEVLQPYIDEGIVTLTEWKEIPGQISSYKHWYENYRHETNWCSFIDLDEFICLTKDINIREWLARHKKYPCYAIYWKMFGTSGKIDSNKNRLIIEQYTSCWSNLSAGTKIIYNTNYDIAKFYTSMMHKLNVKYLGLTIPPINTFGYFINNWDIHRFKKKEIDIQCNHYWSKSYKEYLNKHKRGDAVWNNGESQRNQEMFLWHEHFNRSKDYNIQRFLIELKLKMKHLQ